MRKFINASGVTLTPASPLVTDMLLRSPAWREIAAAEKGGNPAPKAPQGKGKSHSEG